MKRIEVINNALTECNRLMRQHPGDGPFEYVAVQLQYLLDLLTGKCTDKARLRDINIGIVAIREFETRFPEFTENLMEIERIVEEMRFNR